MFFYLGWVFDMQSWRHCTKICYRLSDQLLLSAFLFLCFYLSFISYFDSVLVGTVISLMLSCHCLFLFYFNKTVKKTTTIKRKKTKTFQRPHRRVGVSISKQFKIASRYYWLKPHNRYYTLLHRFNVNCL